MNCQKPWAAARECAWYLNGGFDHRDVDEVLRNALLAEDAAHEVEVPAAPLEGRREREGGAELVERDGAEHGVVHDDRNVEVGSPRPRADLRLCLLELVGTRVWRGRDEAVARIFGGRAPGSAARAAASIAGT